MHAIMCIYEYVWCVCVVCVCVCARAVMCLFACVCGVCARALREIERRETLLTRGFSGREAMSEAARTHGGSCTKM
jgi:hypothetical protein